MALAIKTLVCQCRKCRDIGLIPGSGKSPGGGHGNLLQYFCLENPMDSGGWWATDQRVTKSQTQLKRLGKHVNTAKYVHLVPLLVFRIYLPDTSSTTLYSSHYTFCVTLFLFICFWLCWVFVAAAWAFTLVVGSRGTLQLWCVGFSPRQLLVTGHRLQGLWGLSSCCVWWRSCDSQALKHRLNRCGTWA